MLNVYAVWAYISSSDSVSFFGVCLLLNFLLERVDQEAKGEHRNWR